MTPTTLPCPFCGGRAAFSTRPHKPDGMIVLGCTTKGCVAEVLAFDYPSETEAIAAWNRRAPLDAQERSQPEVTDEWVKGAVEKGALGAGLTLAEDVAAYAYELGWRDGQKDATPALSSQPDQTEEGYPEDGGLKAQVRPIAETLSVGEVIQRSMGDRSKPAGARCGHCGRDLWAPHDHAPDCFSRATPARPEVSSEGVRDFSAAINNGRSSAMWEARALTLAKALNDLRDACLLADAHEELSEHVDGSLLDAAADALSALSSGNGLGISSRDHDQSITGATLRAATEGGE